ncbi:unnamed protein product, partial [Tenebrio molitor]
VLLSLLQVLTLRYCLKTKEMDHFPEGASGTCPLCSKSFASTRLKNRHIKRVHQTVVENCRKSHIIYPLCEERNEVKTQENFRKHLEEKHEVSIENLSLQFSSSQEYEMWKNIKKIETNYAKNRGLNNNGHKEIHYECNRSDIKGFKSKACKRTGKSGGTIKMRGVCLPG